MAHVKPDLQNPNSPELYAWNVTGTDQKSHWTKIGAAWSNKDGKGFNITLEALPVNGKIVLRPPFQEESPEEAAPQPQEPQAAPVDA